MSGGPEIKAGRRQFLVGSASASVAVVGGAMPAAAHADSSVLEAFAASASVVLHDPRLAMDPAVAARLVANGAQMIALDDDPVRLWRGPQGATLRDPQTRLFGLTRWADLLIVRGLAAETRRHLRYEKLDRDADSFVWLIS